MSRRMQMVAFGALLLVVSTFTGLRANWWGMDWAGSACGGTAPAAASLPCT